MATASPNATTFWNTDDALSRANLGEYTHVVAEGGYIKSGLGLQVDLNNLNVTIPTGKAVCDDGSEAYTVETTQQKTLSLTNNAVNKVFLSTDPTVDNDATLEVTTGSAPANPYAKLGEVDTNKSTASEAKTEYRGRDVTIRSGDATQEFNLPVYDDVQNAQSTQGNVVYATGSGNDAEGIWKYDGGSWTILDESGGATAGDLSDLNIDTNKGWGSYDITNVGKMESASVDTDKLSFTGGYAWEEDGQIDESGVSSVTYTLSNTYDLARLDVKEITGSDGSAQDLEFTYNGNTGSYAYQEVGGTEQFDTSYIPLANHGPSVHSASGRVEMAGRWSNRFSLRNMLALSSPASSAAAFGGLNSGSQLNKFSLAWSAGNITITARVLGVSL